MIMKDLFFNLLSNTQKLTKTFQKLINVLKKSYATIHSKQIIPLYLEHLCFLIKRFSWVAIKIYSHFTFEQETFKRDFLLMNKKATQNVKISIEKDFF